MPLICFASPKGGVGKTTLTANTAHALLRAGRRVLVVDLDPQNALRLHFGLPLEDGAGWMAGLAQGQDPRGAIRQTASGVLLLPHGQLGMEGALYVANMLAREPERLAAPMRALLADPDGIVLADLPPGPSPALAVLAPMAGLVACVLQADAMSAALLPGILGGAFAGGGATGASVVERLRVVLNGVDLDSRLSRAVADALAGRPGPRLLGAVGRDEAVAEALAQQRLVLDHAPDGRAALDLRQLAEAALAALPAAPATVPAWGFR